jgi:hypothetical protein
MWYCKGGTFDQRAWGEKAMCITGVIGEVLFPYSFLPIERTTSKKFFQCLDLHGIVHKYLQEVF